MLDRKGIIALVIVGIILLLMPKYYKWVAPPPEPAEETVIVTADSTRAAQPETVPATPSRSELLGGTEAALEPDTFAAAPLEEPVEVIEDYVSIEHPLFHMILASNGQIARYTLKEYDLIDGGPVELHLPGSGSKPVLGTIDFDFGGRNPKSLRDLRFEASTSRLSVTGRDSVILEAGDLNSQYIRLTYIFQSDKYGFDIALQTSGLREPETGEFRTRWLGGVPKTEPVGGRDFGYASAFAMIGDELEEVSAKANKPAEYSATGQTRFVSARSKYFIAAIVPVEAAAGAELAGRVYGEKGRDEQHFYNVSLRQPWVRSASGRWTVYWGPIKLENLQALNAGVDETMNWGWAIIEPFSRLVLWALTGLHSFIPNYGLVVILFSIVVKIVLWPLTRKSQVSMKKMAALQPAVKELREKHKKNPQAMNKAMMDLYKQYGVNPMSGCIPLLLQMPLLYALFIIFRSTIEFRQAPFTMWITDLSQPDVIFNLPFSIPLYGAGVAVLPIVMGVSQFFMSKRTVSDPNQKMMIYIMPVFMTLIFNMFPSGLTLYYTLFNLIAIFEQRLIKIPEIAPVVIDDGKKKPKKDS